LNHTQHTNIINILIPTAENMRHMSSNSLEYKSLVKEGTIYITRLVVSYTHGAKQIFNKVQKRRAEIQRLCSQMQAENKASATVATGKAVVDLTEREDENGNHMSMKIMQIVDDRVNSRTANSVTLAAKKEAKKVATEQVDRHVKCILKQCGIKAELQSVPEGEPPSNSNQDPVPTPTPVTAQYNTQTM
jgi:riboflavin synthase